MDDKVKQKIQCLIQCWFNEDQTIDKLENMYDKLGDLGIIQYPVFENCHSGQRKLLLNEILFYSLIPKNSVVVYTGSASGEHTPNILNLFPTLKFIFIDPNYHVMDVDYAYIYKKNEVVSQPLKEIRYGHWKNLLNMTCCDGQVRDVTQSITFGKFEDLETDFKKNGVWNKRVYVVQDYMSPDLAKKIGLMFPGCYHTSDIRTVFSDNNGKPGDLDYVHNNALQILVIKAMNPILSHLKFRLPNWETKESMDKIPFYALSDIMECKKHGFDFIEDYKQGKYKYFDGTVYIQPWGPPKTMESRLVTDGKTSRYWSYEEYRGKFNMYNLSRSVAFYPYNLKYKEAGYDGCADCALEIAILERYFSQHPSSKYDILSLSKEVTEVTRYRIGDKCSYHNRLLTKRDMMKYGYEVNYKTVWVEAKKQ